MTQQFAVPDEAPPHNPHYSDAFVVFSVTVLSCAIGAWLLLRFGLAFWVGSVAALGVYAACCRSICWCAARSCLPRPTSRCCPGRRQAHAPGAAPPQRLAPLPDAREPRAAERPTSPAAETGRTEPTAAGRPAAAAPPRPTRSISGRRGSPSLSVSVRGGPEPRRAPQGPRIGDLPGLPSGLADGSQPEMSVELIQDLIKKLADELNTATGSEPPGDACRARPRRRGHDRPLGRGAADGGPHDARAGWRDKRCSGQPDTPSRRRPGAGVVADARIRVRPGADRARSRRAAAAQSPARAHRRGGRRRAHGGSARADPRPGRRPAAAFRGQHAAAHGRRRHARSERVRARGAGLRPDAAHRRRQDDPRRAHRRAARPARAGRLGAGDDGRRFAHRPSLHRGCRRPGPARARPWASCFASRKARCGPSRRGMCGRSATWQRSGSASRSRR